MARPLENDFAILLEVVGRHPNGVSSSGIAKSAPKLAPYTLKRRLARLVADGRITRKGDRKGARYFPIAGSNHAAELELSAKALKAQALVRRPLKSRRKIGYQRKFLDSYRPNHTRYLPPALQLYLRSVGSAPAQQGPAGTYVRRILERLLIDLSWNSSRLEGNTYSLLETQKLLSLGRVAEGKDAREAQMILNHKQAIEFLVDSAPTIDFDRFTLLNLHALLSQNLLSNLSAEGRLRTIAVGISNSTYLPPDVPQLVEEYFGRVANTTRAITDPFEQSFFVLVHLPYLQPFEDVNKRVSRLAANIPFIRKNLSPLSFIDVPRDTYVEGLLAIYENNRIELLRDLFVWAYERSAARYSEARQTLGEPDPFRLAHREAILSVVADVVRTASDVADAARRIRSYASANLAADLRARFAEVVETELLNLHEGNIARYRLRPSEFVGWSARRKV